MNFLPTKTVLRFLCFILFGLGFILGCSKDDDETYDAIDATAVTKKINATSSSNPIEAVISGTLRYGALPSSGEAPFKVDFKAWNSKNQRDITRYFWDFNDGSTTRTKNPSHTFTEPGDYTVKLTVKTQRRLYALRYSQHYYHRHRVRKRKPEYCSGHLWDAIPSSGRAPLNVDFKAWNSKNQKYITGYFWDFNDGSTTTDKNPTHTFRKTGEFNVKLSVKNAEGQTHSTTRKITITGSSTTSSDSGSTSDGSTSDGSSSWKHQQ